MGLFSFLRRRKPEDYDELRVELWDAVRAGRPAFAELTDDEGSALRRMASWFVDVKDFVALGGARIDEADEATIALFACLPVLRLGPRWYDDWSTILAAPDGFVHRMTSVDDAGVVTEYDDELSGRVTELGPVLLSLPDVRESGFGDGYNVVVHEMAHKLDERDGALDGCPPLPRSMSRRAWRATFGDAYADFQVRAARSSSGRRAGRASRLPLDEYAAESPDEFFAVACETFFDAPRRLRSGYPEVYAQLASFFAGGA